MSRIDTLSIFGRYVWYCKPLSVTLHMIGINISDSMAEHNNEMNLAWQFIEGTDVSVFLTGRAGTGKTTFLRRLRQLAPKRIVVVAPTGVAAINAEGVTMHSFFQLPFTPYIPGTTYREGNNHYKMGRDKKNLLRTMDLLIIDEISMVRADLLDAVDSVLRKYRDRNRPFGGVQLLMIGDLQQLAPVVKDDEWQMLREHYETPYFFSSLALKQLNYVTIELQRVYRQQDQHFIDLLSAIRNNAIDQHVMEALGSRYIPNFVAPRGEDWIHLTTHNRTAQDFNTHQLQLLEGPSFTYFSSVDGDFPDYAYPADSMITLRRGAQVMFIKNDPSAAHAFYNGKIGIVTSIDADRIAVMCKGDNNSIDVPILEWENTKFTVDDTTKEIREEVIGTFRQYPLRLAWAITIHKSQGLTFDHAILDINDSFAHGQVYVALSRCRTLEGLVLSRPLRINSVISDQQVTDYMKRSLDEATHAESQLEEMRRRYFDTLLAELFSFDHLHSTLAYVIRVVDEHLYHQQPQYLTLLKGMMQRFETEIRVVGERFRAQCNNILAQSNDYAHDATLTERTKKAAVYFADKIEEIILPLVRKGTFAIGNKSVERQFGNAYDAFVTDYRIKAATLDACANDGFALKTYLTSKAKAMVEEKPADKRKARRSKSSTSTKSTRQPKAESTPFDIPQSTHKSFKTKAAAQPKAPKLSTVEQTLILFTQTNDVEQVAQMRQLAESTIYSHLAQLVGDGRLPIDRVVSPARQQVIQKAIEAYDRQETVERTIKDFLPEDYKYGEIRCVLNSIRH